MRGTPGSRICKLVAVAGLALAATPAHANTSTAFPAGSLIIPVQSAYQDDCGSVSAYGLIYDILRANPWLNSHGYQQVTIFYTYLDTKLSPNRCVPTSLDTAPTGSPNWMDGCDMQNVGVAQINNANHAAADTVIVTYDNSAKANVYPKYPSQTLNGAAKANYMGGPFVILPSDVPVFTKLLDNTITAQDVNGNTIDFTPFRTRLASQHLPPSTTCTLGTDHYVNVHRSTTAFVANIGKAFQSTPPRLALLATNKHNHTQAVFDNILEAYLNNAGLGYVGANGCPPLSINAGTLSICPNGATSGQIYDAFDFEDLVNNQLSATSGGKPLYGMLWTPHWETSSTNVVGPNVDEVTALNYIKTFLDGQTGLAAECASVSAYEGDLLDGSQSEESGLQLQTCVTDGVGGCSGSTTPFGINRSQNPPYLSSTALRNCSDPDQSNGALCAYYSYPGDSYSQTGDYIWQAVTGHTRTYVNNATNNSVYKPGVVPLIAVVSNLDTSLTGSPTPYTGTLSASASAARAMIDADLSTRNVKDNTLGKANILYLAGHDQSTSVPGTKVMLETLLQLGLSNLPPMTTIIEVSRNSPIAAVVNGTNAIVQGTYELVNPPVTVPTYSANGDNATFKFPYAKGHLRARTTASITTLASTYAAGSILFDASGGIPDATYTGTGCTPYFTSACRTVFTTTTKQTATSNPPPVFLNASNAGTLGPLMGANLDAANQAFLIQKILAGDDSLFPGLFRPALGGVDRSTVAVIETSQLVNGTRPTMAYFGATDGMIHAVCATTGGVCDIAGRELWAYLPRVSLSTVRYNTARIDGSPHVIDAYGDFTYSGKRDWHTILMFQTGTGDTTGNDREPAVYGIDVSNPASPIVLWEYSIADVAARGNYELGTGLTLSAGRVQSGPSSRFVVFAQTNNAGTIGNGNVVTAINTETGTALWQSGYQFVNGIRSGGTSTPPATGVPGGAVAIDKTQQGFVTDVIYATLYGDLWEVDPSTGASRYGTGPLFQFSTDYHPIGAKPAIYFKGGIQYAVISTGGYAEQFPNDTSWTQAATVNYALSVNLNTPVGDAIIDENKGAPDIGFKLAFGLNEKGYAQATVIGNQVFITTDTADTNDNTAPGAYGTGGATGHVYRMDFTTGTQGTTVVVEGGISSVINSGNAVYVGSSDQQQRLGTDATCGTAGCGTSVDPSLTAKVTRKLWLRTQ